MNVDLYLAIHDGTPNTKDNYRRFLGYVQDYLDARGLDDTDLSPIIFREFLATRDWSNSTEYQAWYAVKGYLAWRYPNQDQMRGFRIKRRDPGPQRTLSIMEVERLFASIDTTTRAGKRDLPMLLLMLDTGLRAAEICRLKIKHVDLAERRLSVLGKGQKWRDAIFSDMTRTYLEDWLETRREFSLPGVDTLFVSVGGTLLGTSLTRDGLRSVFRALGRRAGIEGLSPHVMRRTFATVMTLLGGSTRLVQLAGGWSDIKLVERYTRVLEPEAARPYMPTRVLDKSEPGAGNTGLGGAVAPSANRAEPAEGIEPSTHRNGVKLD